MSILIRPGVFGERERERERERSYLRVNSLNVEFRAGKAEKVIERGPVCKLSSDSPCQTENQSRRPHPGRYC